MIRTAPSPAVDSCRRIRLHDIDWATYRTISDALTGRHVRLTYDRGRLELMTISAEHGFLSRLFTHMIGVLAEELGLGRRSVGDMTCDREDVLRGLEPDECFYIANEPRMRGKRKVDLAVDPPPDLAIEIDISRPSRERQGVYEALGVPELWVFDDFVLVGFSLGAEGYEPIETSRSFSPLRIADLLPFLERRHEVEEGELLRSFREWVREHVRESSDD
jgi:Uma2 family endonuclease